MYLKDSIQPISAFGWLGKLRQKAYVRMVYLTAITVHSTALRLPVAPRPLTPTPKNVFPNMVVTCCRRLQKGSGWVYRPKISGSPARLTTSCPLNLLPVKPHIIRVVICILYAVRDWKPRQPKISNRCPTVKSRNCIFSRHGPPFMVKTLVYNMNYLLRQMNKEKLHHKPNTKGEANLLLRGHPIWT